jgi:hypothetical protein
MDNLFIIDDEIRVWLLSHLDGGWVVFFGDVDLITLVENEFYTPGTEKNRDFKTVMAIDERHHFEIVVGKKNRLPGLENPEHARMVYLMCADQNVLTMRVFYGKDETLEEFVDAYISDHGIPQIKVCRQKIVDGR